MRTQKKTGMTAAREPKIMQQLQPNKTCKCGACVPPKPKLPEGTRRLKVYSKWKANGHEQDPVIMLQGEWLRNNGFNIGDEILVSVNQKQLIVNFEKE